MKHSSENSPTGLLKPSWMLAGILLLLIGVVLFITLVLAPLGIGLILLGVGVTIVSFVRSGLGRKSIEPTEKK